MHPVQQPKQLTNFQLTFITIGAALAGLYGREATEGTFIHAVRDHPAIKVLHKDTATLSNINGPYLDRGRFAPFSFEMHH